MSEKAGELIECVNPSHLYLGSIHYIQPDCERKMLLPEEITVEGVKVSVTAMVQMIHALVNPDPKRWYRFERQGDVVLIETKQVNQVDSDESWQASEALLKR